MSKIGTFEIHAARDGGFDIRDRDRFNPWDALMGLVSLQEAETWATWAHAFKTGHTFASLPEWCQRKETP